MAGTYAGLDRQFQAAEHTTGRSLNAVEHPIDDASEALKRGPGSGLMGSCTVLALHSRHASRNVKED
jgi:hypothetical protein